MGAVATGAVATGAVATGAVVDAARVDAIYACGPRVELVLARAVAALVAQALDAVVAVAVVMGGANAGRDL